ncbi:hypothetical protein Ciccas_013237 [Cichlidogyrus casuarinus]|uniref:Uncharacterized protein n=1 Tax=Cichlidogyrus casuarinus TaxID=1844966 RepID=A0ABD2PL82_9PLAT
MVGPEEYEKFKNFFYPASVTAADTKYADVLASLKKCFSMRKSEFQLRLDCFEIEDTAFGDDRIRYLGHINELVRLSKLNEMSNEQFACLMYIKGIRGRDAADIRSKRSLQLRYTRLQKMSDYAT